MFSQENSQRELHGEGGDRSLELDGQAIPSPGDERLALPAPTAGSSTPDGNLSQPADDDQPRVLEVGGESVKIDKLGPLIVNTDGTLSRITNWQELTPNEQERMVRLVVKKRNKARLAAQQEQSTAHSSSGNLGLIATDLPDSSAGQSGSAASPIPADGGVDNGGNAADPRAGGEKAQRSVEEKVVGLMDQAKAEGLAQSSPTTT